MKKTLFQILLVAVLSVIALVLYQIKDRQYVSHDSPCNDPDYAFFPCDDMMFPSEDFYDNEAFSIEGFDPETIEIGDRIADFVLQDVQTFDGLPMEMARFEFEGETTVSGSYYIGSHAPGIGFTVDIKDAGRVPHLENYTNGTAFCITNEDDARRFLTGEEGRATIRIRNYNIQGRDMGVCLNETKFVGLVEESKPDNL